MRFVVAVALILLLAACGGSEKIDAGEGTATTAPAISTPSNGKILVL
jgi:hypothetical protein